MIAYKWVIKKNNKFYPLINNGAHLPFNNLNLGYYQMGKTCKDFIDPHDLIKRKKPIIMKGDFHRKGFHFWIKENSTTNRFESFQKCIGKQKKKINCVLTCFIRDKDIIMKDDNRLIAKKFRILTEKEI